MRAEIAYTWGYCERCHASGRLRYLVNQGGGWEICRPCAGPRWIIPTGDLLVVSEV